MARPNAPQEKPQQIPIQAAFEMSPWERGTALGMLAFGAAPMVVSWIRLLTMPFEITTWISLSILSLYFFVSIETFSLILLTGC